MWPRCHLGCQGNNFLNINSLMHSGFKFATPSCFIMIRYILDTGSNWFITWSFYKAVAHSKVWCNGANALRITPLCIMWPCINTTKVSTAFFVRHDAVWRRLLWPTVEHQASSGVWMQMFSTGWCALVCSVHRLAELIRLSLFVWPFSDSWAGLSPVSYSLSTESQILISKKTSAYSLEINVWHLIFRDSYDDIFNNLP